MKRSFLALALILPFIWGSAPASAAPAQFDTGVALDRLDIYKSSQNIELPVSAGFGVYGKLNGDADVYSFVADKDGEQTFTLLSKVVVPGTLPYLVLVDPTDGTAASETDVPVPTEGEYHSSYIAPVEGLQVRKEPLLFDEFTKFATQRVKLHQGATYYLVAFGSPGFAGRYAIQAGEGELFSGNDLVQQPGSWFKIKADVYGGTNPFTFTPSTFGSVLFFLAFALLLGIWIIEETFMFLANYRKMAGYLLIKLQPFSRVMTWLALWFMAIGGYIYGGATGWLGAIFVLSIIFTVLAIIFLVRTFKLSPQLMQLEVSKQEATIPSALQRRLYISFAATLVGMIGFLVVLTMHFTA
jgi:hypothetical protein